MTASQRIAQERSAGRPPELSDQSTVWPAAGAGPKTSFVRLSRRQLARWAAVLGILVLVAIGASSWFLVIRDRVIAKKFGVVVPQEVFRSGQISRYLIGDVIDRHQLGAIVNLNGLDHLDADQLSEIDAAKARGVRYYRFPLKGDATGDIDRYASAVAAIVDSQKNRIPVLVHCAAGAQRTGACVAFYRLLMRRDPPEQVIEELRHYGWNPRYDMVLVDYVNAHMGELAALLVQRGLLKEVPAVLPALHP